MVQTVTLKECFHFTWHQIILIPRVTGFNARQLSLANSNFVCNMTCVEKLRWKFAKSYKYSSTIRYFSERLSVKGNAHEILYIRRNTTVNRYIKHAYKWRGMSPNVLVEQCEWITRKILLSQHQHSYLHTMRTSSKEIPGTLTKILARILKTTLTTWSTWYPASSLSTVCDLTYMPRCSLEGFETYRHNPVPPHLNDIPWI